MKRRPVYSRSSKPRSGAEAGPWTGKDTAGPTYAEIPGEPEGPTVRQRVSAFWNRLYSRHQGLVLVAVSALVTLGAVSLYDVLRTPPQNLTASQLTTAVNKVIDERPLGPSLSAVNYAKVIRSVVRVNGYEEEAKPPPGKLDDPAAANPKSGVEEDFHEKFTAVGTGVVIDDQGTILTNLHVAQAAGKLRVTFFDGSESEATVVGGRPDTDLAIVMPKVIPEGLKPATLGSTVNLHPGDEVEAIGFPFGIGPSASAGVVSGLRRAFEQGPNATLTNLIQFDAAANPGNSGGPLIDANGDVVGIVTAILNPSGLRTFAGIGFAVPIETAAGAVGESPL